MRITDVELHEIHPPLKAWNAGAHRLYHGLQWDTRTIVVARTDTGLEGLAEAVGPLDAGLQRDLDRLPGSNPCEWLGHPQLDVRLAPAIYDLVGKANGVPAYRLIGPAVRTWVPVSAWTVSQTPPRMAAEVEHAAALGYTWLKYHTHHCHDAVAQTRAMQEVAPPGFRIHYDLNFDNTVDEVLDLARQLCVFPIAGLLEDPLRTTDLQGHLQLRRRSPLPIVFHHLPLGGREALLELADGYMLGHAPVGDVLRRAGLFEAANVPFMLQNVGGGVTTALVLHMATALERATLHHVTASNLWAEDVVRPALPVVNGAVCVPEGPGLGLELDREALERLERRVPEPSPRTLLRVRLERGPEVWARPSVAAQRDLHLQVPGTECGYANRIDMDGWEDDGSEAFARAWEHTAEGPVRA